MWLNDGQFSAWKAHRLWECFTSAEKWMAPAGGWKMSRRPLHPFTPSMSHLFKGPIGEEEVYWGHRCQYMLTPPATAGYACLNRLLGLRTSVLSPAVFQSIFLKGKPFCSDSAVSQGLALQVQGLIKLNPFTLSVNSLFQAQQSREQTGEAHSTAISAAMIAAWLDN